jgi:hypothetical protein
MNCRHFSRHMVELLDAGPGREELSRHAMSCPRCAAEYEETRQTIALLTPSHTFGASPHLKERIMSEITKREVAVARPAPRGRAAGRRWRPILAAGVAATLVLVAWVGGRLAGHRGGPGAGERGTALNLLSQAWAAEESLFPANGVIHIVNQVAVLPVSDATMARARWLPLCSLGASGKLEIHQLSLSAAPGEEYTVTDEAWYDRATGRFARVLGTGGKTVFANAYDGAAVYSLQDAGGVQKEPVSAGFTAPASPAEFLGIAAGLRNRIEAGSSDLVEAAGEGTLADGSPVSVLKAGLPDPEGNVTAYCLFRIRHDDTRIAEMEFVVGGEPQLLVRRVATELVREPGVPWDLAGVTGAAPSQDVGVRPDMVRNDVSVQHMVDTADFETYLFSTAPAWAPERTIVDVLDLASPPQRMFFIACRASDGRHVVLVQAPSYNRMLGPLVKTGRLVYESPNGFKVWSGPRDQWLADILLKSARAWIKDPSAPDRTGYALESPAGTFPCLAVNGPITESELHGLIDSLVPAKSQAAR